MFGTKASLIVDLFLAIQVLIVPALAVAVVLVRKGRVKAHARIMVTCFVLFVLSVAVFEVDVRSRQLPVRLVPLVIHLCFALPATILWIRQIATARSALTEPSRHRKRGKLVFALLVATVATGLWLYVASFA